MVFDSSLLTSIPFMVAHNCEKKKLFYFQLNPTYAEEFNSYTFAKTKHTYRTKEINPLDQTAYKTKEKHIKLEIVGI